jgi:hypothetical protein
VAGRPLAALARGGVSVSAARIPSPGAGLRTLEARIVDVEKRHGEAIALLAQFITERAGKEFTAATLRHEEADRLAMLLDELVPKAAERLFEKWKAAGQEARG